MKDEQTLLRLEFGSPDTLVRLIDTVGALARGEMENAILSEKDWVSFRPAIDQLVLTLQADSNYNNRNHPVAFSARSVYWNHDVEGWREVHEKLAAMRPNSHTYFAEIEVSYMERKMARE